LQSAAKIGRQPDVLLGFREVDVASEASWLEELAAAREELCAVGL
jgi:hypothetical protein